MLGGLGQRPLSRLQLTQPFISAGPFSFVGHLFFASVKNGTYGLPPPGSFGSQGGCSVAFALARVEERLLFNDRVRNY